MLPEKNLLKGGGERKLNTFRRFKTENIKIYK